MLRYKHQLLQTQTKIDKYQYNHRYKYCNSCCCYFFTRVKQLPIKPHTRSCLYFTPFLSTVSHFAIYRHNQDCQKYTGRPTNRFHRMVNGKLDNKDSQPDRRYEYLGSWAGHAESNFYWARSSRILMKLTQSKRKSLKCRSCMFCF